MLMRDASLKQRTPYHNTMSIFGAVLAGKKCVLYMDKYSNVKVAFFNRKEKKKGWGGGGSKGIKRQNEGSSYIVLLLLWLPIISHQ